MNTQRHNPAYRFAWVKSGWSVGKIFPKEGLSVPDVEKFFRPASHFLLIVCKKITKDIG